MAATADRVIDLLDPQSHDWDTYTWLREEAPLYFDPVNELYCVSRHADVIHVAKKPKLFTSAEGNLPKMPPDPSFINLDGHQHAVRRGKIRHLFTPSAIARLEDHIRDSTDALIDAVIEQGSCDFVSAIAAPLPMQIVCEFTGVPEEFREDARHWLDLFFTGGQGPWAVTEEVNEAFIMWGGLHYMLVDEVRANPRDDLLSLWVHGEFDGEKLDDDQLLFEHTMMIIGGSETTRNAISGGVEMLMENPEQRDWLRDHPEDIPNAVEEILRWVTPFIRMSRTATQDVELLGQTLHEGDEIMMLYPPANRDPRVFPDPDRFDVRRDFGKAKILSFGYGRHFCIGAYLARLEARVVLEQMLRRMPDFEPDGPGSWAASSFTRGMTSLPIRFTPGPRSRS